MANKNKGLVDPANKGSDDTTLKDELDALDPDNKVDEVLYLRPEEIGTIREKHTGAPHPFDGYEFGRKIALDEALISTTYIVLLNPNSEPVEDKSNLGVTVYMGGDGTPKQGKATIVNMPTSHTRCVTDRSGKRNETVVFDREITLGDGRKFKCAVVKSHAARAQIVFQFDPKRNKITPDKRYALADPKQGAALHKMFAALHYQRTKAERAAREFDASPESTAADKE